MAGVFLVFVLVCPRMSDAVLVFVSVNRLPVSLSPVFEGYSGTCRPAGFLLLLILLSLLLEVDLLVSLCECCPLWLLLMILSTCLCESPLVPSADADAEDALPVSYL